MYSANLYGVCSVCKLSHMASEFLRLKYSEAKVMVSVGYWCDTSPYWSGAVLPRAIEEACSTSVCDLFGTRLDMLISIHRDCFPSRKNADTLYGFRLSCCKTDIAFCMLSSAIGLCLCMCLSACVCGCVCEGEKIEVERETERVEELRLWCEWYHPQAV